MKNSDSHLGAVAQEDTFNGLMAFPNLVALVLLSPVVWRVTKDFIQRTGSVH